MITLSALVNAGFYAAIVVMLTTPFAAVYLALRPSPVSATVGVATLYRLSAETVVLPKVKVSARYRGRHRWGSRR